MNELKGKYALVTGSAKGIGRGIALALADAGANLFLHYRSEKSEAESLLSDIRRKGVEAQIFCADLGKEDELEALFSAIKKDWGKLDIAVNNAGWDPGFMALEDLSYEKYRKLSDINIKGTLFCCLREIELMKNRGGSIINIGSVQQDTSVPGRTLYAMSKGAIHSMTGQLALECGELGIRINNIAPGYIEVDRMSKASGYDKSEVEKDIPLGRVGNVEDIGNFAVYLASEKASFITGQTLIADGGVSRKLARSRK